MHQLMHIFIIMNVRLPYLISTKTKIIFQLSFSVPPNKPLIRDGNGKKMTKTLGPYKIGDKLFATCSTTGGKLWNIVNINIMAFQKFILRRF